MADNMESANEPSHKFLITTTMIYKTNKTIGIFSELDP